MRSLVRRYPMAAFIVLAFGASWAFWIPLAVHGALVTPGGSTTHFPGLMGPAVAAFVVTALVDGRRGMRDLVARMVHVSRPAPRFAAYALSPVGFLLLALALMLVTHTVLPAAGDFLRYSGLPVLSVPGTMLLVLLFSGFGEETGWRGFALPRLQARYGALPGALVLALIWAAWHTPAFWFVEGYRAMGVAGLIGGFGLGICAGSIVLARVANRTQGSILAAALWHATYNLTSATAASRGLIGAVTTTCVMVWAVVLVVQELARPVQPSRLRA